MPNWCECEIEVKGGKRELKAFRDFCKGEDVYYSQKGLPEALKDERPEKPRELELDFNRFIPVPKRILEKGYSSAGYDWQIKNWGTKWNASDPVWCETKNGLVVAFSTAWAPPTPIFHAMVQKFKTLRFTMKYYEGGMGFSGWFKGKQGKIYANMYNENYRGGRGG